MAAEAKALLDELMGRTRNLDPSQQPEDITWSNPDVCRHFLCGFCPHELFTNTRADLGPCTKLHDEALRKEYQNSSRFEKYGYEDNFMRLLQTLISDVEKRIKRGHLRLALNSQQSIVNGAHVNQNEEKIKLLSEKINNLVEQAEELGCEGKVEEAQGVMKLVDQLKEERHQLEMHPVQDDGPMMKQMEVCEVCGAFLIVGDAPQRQDEHLMGKQHAGYAQVRAEIEKRKQRARDEIALQEANEAKLRQEREERERKWQKERRQKERERERDRERKRERQRNRHSRSRSRDRQRSRSRDRQRRRSSSRDRDRRRSQRSRSRNRRHRSRSSSRSRHSSRRSSSRDRKSNRRRSHERRSRSRNRSRSKDRKSKNSDKNNKNSEGDKRRRDMDKMSDNKSRKEISHDATRETECGDASTLAGKNRRSLEDDSLVPMDDTSSDNQKSAEDDPEEGHSDSGRVLYGADKTEGDTKIDE